MASLSDAELHERMHYLDVLIGGYKTVAENERIERPWKHLHLPYIIQYNMPSVVGIPTIEPDVTKMVAIGEFVTI